MSSTPAPGKHQLYNFIFVGCLWLVFFTQLWYEWNHNDQYGYGVFMPLLGLYLLHARWKDKPTAKPLLSIEIPLLILIFTSIVLLYPIKTIFEANADWRLIGWVQGLLTLSITVLTFAIWGGWRWAFHFSIPFIFFLFGIPWPTQMEVFTIHHLLNFVTLCTVETLNILGIFAIQTGNLIRLTTGIISMEEACSGVRSFQSSIMLGFFLGELFRCNIWKRACLITLGACFSIFFNTVRTVSLSLIAAQHGIVASESWHDFASNSVFIACLVALILAAFILKSKQPETRQVNNSTTLNWIQPPVVLTFSIILLLSEVFVYGWFHLRPPLPYEGYSWKIDWSKIKNLKEHDMAYFIQDVLLFDIGHHNEWTTEGRYNWTGFYFHWNHPKGAQLAGFHGPDLCLPAAGWKVHEKGEPFTWSRDEIQLTINPYSFVANQKFVYIFYCQWDQSNYPYYSKKGTMRLDRLTSTWHGHLKRGKIVLEIVVSGMNSLKQAKKEFVKFLDDTIIIESPEDS